MRGTTLDIIFSFLRSGILDMYSFDGIMINIQIYRTSIWKNDNIRQYQTFVKIKENCLFRKMMFK